MSNTIRIMGEYSRQKAAEEVLNAPQGTFVTLKDKDRTLEQNALQWPYLRGFAQQMEWEVNGELTRLTEEEWKAVLTAAFQGELRVAKGYGQDSVVILGLSTRAMDTGKFAEWMEFLMAQADWNDITPVFVKGLDD